MMSLSLTCDLGGARKPLLSSGVALPHTQLILWKMEKFLFESALALLIQLFTGLIEHVPEPVTVTITSLQELG